MSDAFYGEIRVVGFNFPPKGWAFCDGQLMPLSQNTALFALLGTAYGGDGKSTFALPDIQGRAVVDPGQGQGQEYVQGEMSGEASVTLLESEMPLHTHSPRAVPDPADQHRPDPTRAFARSAPARAYQSNASSSLKTLAPQTLAPAGGGLPHNNFSPVLAMNYVIALQGEYPQRY